MSLFPNQLPFSDASAPRSTMFIARGLQLLIRRPEADAENGDDLARIEDQIEDEETNGPDAN